MTAPQSSHASTRWICAIAAAWVSVFLWQFFRTPIQDPEIPRTDILMMIIDTVLGVDSGATPDSAIPSGMQFLPQRIPLFGWATLLLAAAACHGLLITTLLLRSVKVTTAERVVLIMGTGLAALSTVTLIAGLFGILTASAIFLPSGLSLVAVAFMKFRKGSAGSTIEIDDAGASGAEELEHRPDWVETWFTRLAILVVAVFSVYLFFGAVSPPTDFDVREYHLQGPKEWFQQGRITYLRHNVYTSFPFLSEMLCLAGMVVTGDWWTGAIVGQIVLACFQLLTTLAVYCIGRRWLNRTVGIVAALISLTTPWTLRISIIAYAEGSLTFYLVATLMTLMLCQRIGTSLVPGDYAQSCRRRLLLLTGLLAGAAMASKYTGLVSVIVPACVFVLAGVFRTRSSEPQLPFAVHPGKERAIDLATLLCGCGLVMAPWLLRNLADTGNPVFPLGYSVFGGSEWSAERNAQWKKAHSADEHSLREVPRHFLDAAVRNKWTSGLLFGLGVPAVLLWKRRPALRPVLLLAGWSFLTWWALTHRIDRFWIPAIPLMSLLGASLFLLNATAWRWFLATVITVVTAWNIQFSTLALVGFHVGLMDLDAARQMVIRSDIKALNAELTDRDKVLFVGEAEVFDATFPLVYNTVFDDCLLEEWTRDSGDSAPPRKQKMRGALEIRDELQRRGITHVVVNWREILRYRSPGSYGYSEYVQPSRFLELVDNQVLESPTVLLHTPFSSLSSTEQKTVREWDGWEQLTEGDVFRTVLLYRVKAQ
ncbi:MAG: hypothetical protein JNM43_10200 [Planctomycetaceae bacterium]|nr:hypothetical protein [Planctomycetaceae bacterium]